MALDGNSIEVIDNFLSEEDFKKVSAGMHSDWFPWYFNEFVADPTDGDHFYFTHKFYGNSKIESPNFNPILMPLLKNNNHTFIIFVPLNCKNNLCHHQLSILIYSLQSNILLTL